MDNGQDLHGGATGVAPDALPPVITIDGPTASGKGTVSTRVAQALGWHTLDSGALYRLAALACMRRNVAADDVGCVADLARSLDVEFRHDGSIWLEGEDVTEAIRREEVGSLASRIAAYPELRAALLERQRAFRRFPGLVADGRDMGTVVFPDARLKVFLDASVETRAKRRYQQLRSRGISATLKDLQRELQERDMRDRNRAAAPLVPASDARILDNSALSIDETVGQILAWFGRSS